MAKDDVDDELAPRVRRVRLTLSRIDPWSTMKLAFIASLCIGLALVVATAVLWKVIDAVGIWASINSLANDISGGQEIPVLEYLQFGKALSFSVVVAVLDVVLLTAMATLGAFIYNLVAQLLGGLNVTFTDD